MKYSQCNDFSFDTALVLLQSTDPYPVNFDTAWQWLGYSDKQKVKDKLINNFDEKLDFLITTECSYQLFQAIRTQDRLFADFVLTHPPNNSKDTKIGSEQMIQKRLLDYFGSTASKEVRTPSGRIDILTPDYLIEIKSCSTWRSGLGQLLACGTEYPDRQKILYLFDFDYRLSNSIYNTCKLQNIEVWLHSDWDRKLPKYTPSESKKKNSTDKEIILSTVDCFKTLCVMVGTEKAKEVRRHFLECERRLKMK